VFEVDAGGEGEAAGARIMDAGAGVVDDGVEMEDGDEDEVTDEDTDEDTDDDTDEDTDEEADADEDAEGTDVDAGRRGLMPSFSSSSL